MTNPAFENLRLNLNMIYDPATALERGEALFLQASSPVSQNETRQEAATAPVKRHSEENPYHLAVFTHELVKAAQHLTDVIPTALDQSTGLCSLLTVIEERCNLLSLMLDQRKYCEDWDGSHGVSENSSGAE